MYSSRTDLNPTPVPAPPNVGGALGIGTVVVDPDFHNLIVRVTDSNTYPSRPGATFYTDGGGSGMKNTFNRNSTLFVVDDTGGSCLPCAFDPVKLKVTRLYADKFPQWGGLKINGDAQWSRTNSNWLYVFTGTKVVKYDFTDRVNVPSPQTVFDFTQALPAGFTPTWVGNGGVGAADNCFVMAFSNTGTQNTGTYVAIYRPNKGWRLLNTATGVITGSYGIKGKMTCPDRFTIHNVKYFNGYALITKGDCTSSSCGNSPYFWNVNNLSVVDGLPINFGGHWVGGYKTFINSIAPGKNAKRLYTAPNKPSFIDPAKPVGCRAPLDTHPSWNNADSLDTKPFFTTTWIGDNIPSVAWENEVIGTDPVAGTVYRFCHTFNKGDNPKFATAYAIGQVDQLGKFFMFSSDWMGTLGTDLDGNARGDVFIVELK